MQPSKRQLTVYDCWEQEDKNILMQAVAGSGKTTTLLELIRRSKGNVLYLAFNKSIKLETEKKLEEKGITNGEAMTLHSLGLKAIIKSRIKFSIKNGKFYSLFKEMKEKNSKNFKNAVNEIGSKGIERPDEALYMTLKEMNDISRLFLTAKYEEVINIMIDMDKFPVDNKFVEVLWADFLAIRKASYEKPLVEIDFADMIYIPIRFGLFIPVEHDYLMIDECQDLNLAQHKFIDQITSQGSIKKWVACGDRNQSIYGFSGAYPESFDLFGKKPNVKELPLDINYRCATDIIKQSNEVYDVIKPFKTNKGRVSKYLAKDPESFELEKFFKSEMSNSSEYRETLIICRNKKPLFSMYFSLLERGIPAFIMGDDILKNVIRMLKPYGDTPVNTIVDIFERQIEEFELKMDPEKDQAKLFYMKEDLSNLQIVINRLCTPLDRGSDLLESFKILFEDKNNAVTLCSIHKSKGLEADKVVILNETLIPSKFAKKPAQIVQEINLKYVARTRAKEQLIYLEI